MGWGVSRTHEVLVMVNITNHWTKVLILLTEDFVTVTKSTNSTGIRLLLKVIRVSFNSVILPLAQITTSVLNIGKATIEWHELSSILLIVTVLVVYIYFFLNSNYL